MRFPPELYQLETMLAQHLPTLRPAQQRGLAVWVYGTMLAQSACQNAVITALLTIGTWHTLRQYLREWLYDGKDKAAPCRPQVNVEACFAPLLGWLLSWWQGAHLALAVDATAHGDRVVALVVSVLYRGCAIPVAWHVLPASQPGAWMSPLLRLLRLLRPAVPPNMTVLVLADRGLWSPRLWKRIRDLGWHPVLRVQQTITFQPDGQKRQPVRQLIPGPGYAWVGYGTAFKERAQRRRGTLLIIWDADQAAPWVLLTDLSPERVGLGWYGLRVWVELGFRACKGIGWQWQRTRRTDPERVARYWLVLAVATLWVLATGTRADDALDLDLPPAQVRTPRPLVAHRQRLVSVFRLGLTWVRWQLARGRLWQRLWLTPEPWPRPPAAVEVIYHVPS
jgi:DDE family transposase